MLCFQSLREFTVPAVPVLTASVPAEGEAAAVNYVELRVRLSVGGRLDFRSVLTGSDPRCCWDCNFLEGLRFVLLCQSAASCGSSGRVLVG